MNARTSLRYASLVMIVVMVVALLPGVFGVAGVTAPKPSRVNISAARTYGMHSVPPARGVLMQELIKEGLPLNASETEIQDAANRWFKKFSKQSETWVNSSFQEYLNQREEQMAADFGKNFTILNPPIVPVSVKVYGMAVDFGATETFTLPVEQDDGTCMTETTTIVGPLQGDFPSPAPEDNFTLWYLPDQTADPSFYEKLVEGYQGAGRVRFDLRDPVDNLPGINLTGYTVQDYYDNVAGVGNVTIDSKFEGWVTVPYSEGRYGADNCASGSHGGGAGVPVAQLVPDALDVFMAAHPGYWTDPNYWPLYDTDHDGFVDTFWLIHAGADQSAGGGEQGTFAIWAHSSDLRNYAAWPDGYKVYEGAPGPADDIYVGPYTMQPENADVGVFAEEFGHNFFGFPDLYATDLQGSIGDWAIMEAGAWMGWLGGTVPASMPLWFKYIAAYWDGTQWVPVNWHSPMARRMYTDPAEDITIGQLEKTPGGVLKGVRVNMPNYDEDIENPLGTGKAPYSGTARNQTDILLKRNIDIPSGATGLLSFESYWEIEEDWDYGYVTINGASIPDMDGITTDTNPNGNNLGNGITGFGEATMHFDLSTYAGTTVELGFRYKTDAAVTEFGWVIDDLMLDGALIDDFESATEPGNFPGWTNTDPGWLLVPTFKSYAQYYMVEWRSLTKYDQMIAKTAYIHNYILPNADIVSRIPYNMPAALIYFRNTKYSATYAMAGNEGDPPSYGSKYQILLVDPNWEPLRLGDTPETYLGYWNSRLSSYDAGLTLQATQAFTIPAYYGLPGEGPWYYESKPPVTKFNDTLGYYGGFYYGSPCQPGYICYTNRSGSAVVPARDLYSTRITDFDYQPLYGLYGAFFPPSWLGSGNPGDDNVQHGVNIELLSKAGDDAYNSTATLRFSNYSVDYYSVGFSGLTPDGFMGEFLTAVVNTGTETAEGVEYWFTQDPYFHITDVQVAGPMPFTLDAESLKNFKMPADAKSVEVPEQGVKLLFTSIPPGEAMYIMIAGSLDLDPVPSTEAWGTVEGADGQVYRGPWWVPTIDMNNYLFVPIIIKDD